ncbi:hypothetical protein BC830DRAFT_433567 [Chytriomyces sp. MP71]|nr:hypothetical protein BC830DRAFT_433567 [Chytriomyces sp. MP71]
MKTPSKHSLLLLLAAALCCLIFATGPPQKNELGPLQSRAPRDAAMLFENLYKLANSLFPFPFFFSKLKPLVRFDASLGPKDSNA